MSHPKKSQRMHRTYPKGYLSRSQLGVKLGLKGFSWHLVQKALVMAGFLKRESGQKNGVPTEKGALVSLLIEEVDEAAKESSWYVWNPTIVDELRAIMDTPKFKAKASDEPVAREYPEGYTSCVSIAKLCGVQVKVVIAALIDAEIAERDSSNALVPVDVPSTGTDEFCTLWTEGEGEREKSWWLWRIDTISPKVPAYINKLAANATEVNP